MKMATPDPANPVAHLAKLSKRGIFLTTHLIKTGPQSTPRYREDTTKIINTTLFATDLEWITSYFTQLDTRSLIKPFR